MAALFAADVEVLANHFGEDILIADGGADDFAAGFTDDNIQAGIAHDGGDKSFPGESAPRRGVREREWP